MVRHVIGLSVALVLTTPVLLAAQTNPALRTMPVVRDFDASSVPLSHLLPQLYLRVIVREADALDGFTGTFGDDFRESRLDAAYQIDDMLSGMLSSFPLVSSAGGFSWTFDPVLGTFMRSSDSFGPLFVERALTIGKHRLNLGANYQRVSFDRLEGKNLRGGEIVGYTGLPHYLADDHHGVFYAEALDLQATTSTMSVFATFGLSDRLDIGVAVPINRVELKATLVSTYGNSLDGLAPRFMIPDCDPAVSPENCDWAPVPTTASESGTASGLGDITLRVKYNFVRHPRRSLAAAVDVRMPTGDEQNLLGIAGHQTKSYLIGTTTFGRVSPHVNVGYTLSGKSAAVDDEEFALIEPPDEINFAAGADIVASLRTTVTLAAVSRTLRGTGNLEQGDSDFRISSDGPKYQEFQLVPDGDLNLLLGSAGVRVNPKANLLLSLNVLLPLTQRGLTDRATWLVGFDYSF